jgi:hypothetical protein
VIIVAMRHDMPSAVAFAVAITSGTGWTAAGRPRGHRRPPGPET